MSFGSILYSALWGGQTALAAGTLAAQAQAASTSGTAAQNQTAAGTPNNFVPAGPIAKPPRLTNPALWRGLRPRPPIQVIDRRVERGEIPAQVQRAQSVRTKVPTPTHSARVPKINVPPAARSIRSVRLQTAVAAAGALLVALPAQAADLVAPAREKIDLPWELDVLHWMQANPELSLGLALGAGAAVLTTSITLLVVAGKRVAHRISHKRMLSRRLAAPSPLVQTPRGNFREGAGRLVVSGAGAALRLIGRIPAAFRARAAQAKVAETPAQTLVSGGSVVATGANLDEILNTRIAEGMPKLERTATLEDLRAALGQIDRLNRARMMLDASNGRFLDLEQAGFLSEGLLASQNAITSFVTTLNGSTLEKRQESLDAIDRMLNNVQGVTPTPAGNRGSGEESGEHDAFYAEIRAFVAEGGPARAVLARAGREFIPHHSTPSPLDTVIEGFNRHPVSSIFFAPLDEDVPFANRVMDMNDALPNGLGEAHVGSTMMNTGDILFIDYDEKRLGLIVRKENDGAVYITATVRGDIIYQRVQTIPENEAAPARVRQELHAAREYLRTTARAVGKIKNDVLTMEDANPVIALAPPFATHLTSVALESGTITSSDARLDIVADREMLGHLQTVTCRGPNLLRLTYGHRATTSDLLDISRDAHITITALTNDNFTLEVHDPYKEGEEEERTDPGLSFSGRELAARLLRAIDALVLSVEDANDKKIVRINPHIFRTLAQIRNAALAVADHTMDRNVAEGQLRFIDQEALLCRSAGMTQRALDAVLNPLRELLQRKMAPEVVPEAPTAEVGGDPEISVTIDESETPLILELDDDEDNPAPEAGTTGTAFGVTAIPAPNVPAGTDDVPEDYAAVWADEPVGPALPLTPPESTLIVDSVRYVGTPPPTDEEPEIVTGNDEDTAFFRISARPSVIAQNLATTPEPAAAVPEAPAGDSTTAWFRVPVSAPPIHESAPPAASTPPVTTTPAVEISIPADMGGRQIPAGYEVPLERKSGPWAELRRAGRALAGIFGFGRRSDAGAQDQRRGREGPAVNAPTPPQTRPTSHNAVADYARDGILSDTPAYITAGLNDEWSIELGDQAWIAFDQGRPGSAVTFRMNLRSRALRVFLADNFGEMRRATGLARTGLPAGAYARLLEIIKEDNNPLTKNAADETSPGFVYTIDDIFKFGLLLDPRAAIFVLLAVYAYLGVRARIAEEKGTGRPVILVDGRSPDFVHVVNIPADMGAYQPRNPGFQPRVNIAINSRKSDYTVRGDGQFIRVSHTPRP